MKSKNYFEPYGIKLLPINSTDNRMKYTGQERDTFTNYDYMHFRFYASSMGRFLKPDNVVPSAFNPQSRNLYTYVNGNPLNYNDPSGHTEDQPLQQENKQNQPVGPTQPSTQNIEAMKTQEQKMVDQPKKVTAVLLTDMTNGETILRINNPTADVNYVEYIIPTSNEVVSNAQQGAQNGFISADVYQKNSIKSEAYGPEGAYIEVGNQYDIHGGGTQLAKEGKDPYAANQELKATKGCTRGHNEDVIALGGLITAFKSQHSGENVNYIRFGTPSGATKQTKTIPTDAPIVSMMREGMLRLYKP